MWLLNALIVHILLLISLVIVYFQSNLIPDLQPQKTLRDLDLEPPADRLVIFFIDGLGANTFFRNKCEAVPHIGELFRQQGLVGIIHTNAPTNSRPANIATFAGFQEDPSAALTNFNTNPTEFDTVFNRSRSAYGWGSFGVLEFFANMPNGGVDLKFKNYTDRKITTKCKADEWVHEKVKDFLAQDKNVKDVLNQTTSVFYIYLADMDMSGHLHKPTSKIYLKQLYSTQQRIREIYELFEQKFQDNRTVYLMTSDHGMTISGSHGGRSLCEIEVPFFIWGAGVNREAPSDGITFTADRSGFQMPLHELQQIQLASLMSALIGLPPPMNNMGILPLGYMKVTPKYEAEAAHLNALQLLSQVASVLTQFKEGLFSQWLPQFEKLDSKRLGHYDDQVMRLMSLRCYNEAMNTSKKAAELAVECLEFYKNYYQIALIVATVASYMGWIYYLLIKMGHKEKEPIRGCKSPLIIFLNVFGLTILLPIMLLQRVPGWTTFYLFLPIWIWTLALRNRPLQGKAIVLPIVHATWILSVACLIVATFIDRRLLWIGFVIAMCAYNRHRFAPSKKFVIWLALLLLLGVFTTLPPSLGREDKHLLCLSMFVALLRPLASRERFGMRVWIINGGVLLMGAYCSCLNSSHDSFLISFHTVAIGYTVYAFLSIPFSNTTRRLSLIWFNLSTVYTLLSTSYESFFIQLMIMEYFLNRKVHDEEIDVAFVEKPVEQLHCSYRYATFVLLYVCLSFFGIGELASISSFDPNTARLFMTGDSIIWVGFLVLVKLSIPSIIIISGMYSSCFYVRYNVRHIFTCLFLMADTLSLYYFLQVRNEGTWREIRFSISHLLIVHFSAFVIMIHAGIARLLLSSIRKFSWAEEDVYFPRFEIGAQII